MAQSAGDLLIRIAADFAELNTGLSEVGGKLDAFGGKVNAHNQKMQGMFTSLVSAAKLFIGALAVREIYEYGKSIEQSVGNLADMADNLKMNVDEFQAFTNAAYLAGQKTEAVSTAIGKFNVFMGKASEGSKEQIERLNDLGVKILDVNGKMRPQADLLQEIATKLVDMQEGARRAANEVAFFGKSGQAVSATLEQWKKGTVELNRELEAQGLRHTPEVIKAMDDLADRSDRAAKKVEVFVAPFYALVKTKVMETIASLIKEIANSIALLGSHLDVMDKIAEIANIISGGTAAKMDGRDASTRALDSVTRLQSEYAKLADGIEQQKVLWGENSSAFKDYMKDVETARLRYQQGMKTLTTGGVIAGPLGDKPETTGGASNPGVKGAGDSFLEEIKKLELQTQAAKDALDAMLSSNRDKGLDKIKADIEAQKKIADMVAAFSAKKDSGPYVEQFKKAADAFGTMEAAAKDVDKVFTQGNVDAQKYGNGVNTLALRQKDLSRELKLGRITQEEYNNAMKDADEAARAQANSYGRLRGGLEGFKAGIDDARAAFEKSNDAYAMGQQTFNGLTTAMSESFDILAGKSNKTFGDIASDFGRMLAKMALQAALSPVFKMLFGFLGAATGGGSGEMFGPPAPASGGNRAAGGDVFDGTSYMVGEHGPERFTPSVSGNISPYKSADGGGVTVNLSLGTTSGATNPTAAMEFGKKIKQAVTDVLMMEKRPGGLLYGG